MASTVIDKPSAKDPESVRGDRHDRSSMKMVSCIIRPESLDAVKNAVGQLELVGGMTVSDVRGFGRQKGQVEHYRGGEYLIRFLSKLKIDMAVREEDVDRVMGAISKAAHTGKVGDGKVFVVDLHNVVRIRTGERGAIAL